MTDEEKDRAHHMAIVRSGHVADVVKALIAGAVVVLGLYFISDTIKAFAGKESQAAVDIPIDGIASWVTTFLFGVWGVFQHRVRKSETERFTSRIRELELRIDPGRSSMRDIPSDLT